MKWLWLLCSLFLLGCSGERPAPLLPLPNFKSDAVQGQALYLDHCSRCHGENLRGNPRNGPPLINEVYHPGHHADLAFYQAVRNGVRQHHWHFGNMPALDEVTPEMAAHVIAYVRAEQHKAGIF